MDIGILMWYFRHTVSPAWRSSVLSSKALYHIINYWFWLNKNKHRIKCQRNHGLDLLTSPASEKHHDLPNTNTDHDTSDRLDLNNSPKIGQIAAQSMKHACATSLLFLMAIYRRDIKQGMFYKSDSHIVRIVLGFFSGIVFKSLLLGNARAWFLCTKWVRLRGKSSLSSDQHVISQSENLNTRHSTCQLRWVYYSQIRGVSSTCQG